MSGLERGTSGLLKGDKNVSVDQLNSLDPKTSDTKVSIVIVIDDELFSRDASWILLKQSSRSIDIVSSLISLSGCLRVCVCVSLSLQVTAGWFTWCLRPQLQVEIPPVPFPMPCKC